MILTVLLVTSGNHDSSFHKNAIRGAIVDAVFWNRRFGLPNRRFGPATYRSMRDGFWKSMRTYVAETACLWDFSGARHESPRQALVQGWGRVASVVLSLMHVLNRF